jgi:hypothetical protein
MTHSFDDTLRLEPAGPHRWRGAPGQAYWNMVGPFGGTTAAAMLQAVMLHPELLGAPAALTVNYAAPITDAPFVIEARPVRTNRSTQHWTLVMTQAGADGEEAVVTTGTAVTALRRATWGGTDAPMPQVPPPADLPAVGTLPGIAWSRRYELRPIEGAPPLSWDGAEGIGSLSRLWMRDTPPRPLDFCALAAFCDMFYPRVWLRRASRVPAGTVSITVYFHADAASLAATGDGYLLGQAQGQEFRNGFFDQSVQVWNAAGTLLATSHQIVYYKE